MVEEAARGRGRIRPVTRRVMLGWVRVMGAVSTEATGMSVVVLNEDEKLEVRAGTDIVKGRGGEV